MKNMQEYNKANSKKFATRNRYMRLPFLGLSWNPPVELLRHAQCSNFHMSCKVSRGKPEYMMLNTMYSLKAMH